MKFRLIARKYQNQLLRSQLTLRDLHSLSPFSKHKIGLGEFDARPVLMFAKPEH